MFIAGSVKLDVTLSPGTGKFEVCENGTLVSSGYVRAASDNGLIFESNDARRESKSEALNLDSGDIYKELRLRGYDYGPSFRGVVSAAGNGTSKLNCMFRIGVVLTVHIDCGGLSTIVTDCLNLLGSADTCLE